MRHSESGDLAAKLRAWTVDPQVPARFQRDVWQRIAARPATREAPFWPRVLHWVATQFVRPQYATGLIALSLLASFGVARIQARDANARHWKALESRYATSIDPLAMAR